MSNFIRCHKAHPYRPVDWRWERARFLSDNPSASQTTKYDDDLVREARRFQLKLKDCKEDLDKYVILEQCPDMYYAYELWDEDESGGNRWSSHPCRFEIEARILAQEPLKTVADRVGVTEKTIEIYEQLFFNVIDRIRNTSYIMNQVLGPSVHKGLTDRDYDILWKLLGYFAGGIVLDAFITSFADVSKPDSPEKVDQFCRDWTRSLINMKAAIAAKTMPVNTYTQTQILEVYARHRELEQDIDPIKAKQSMLANIGIMLQSVPWAVGQEPSAYMDKKLLGIYDQTIQAEPRADEIVKAGIDGAIIDSLKDYKFPDVEPEKQK